MASDETTLSLSPKHAGIPIEQENDCAWAGGNHNVNMMNVIKQRGLVMYTIDSMSQ